MGSRPFHVEGLKELDAMLSQLSKSMAKTVLRNALKKAGAPVRDAAAALAPVDDGELASSLAVSPKLKKSQKPGGYRDRTAVNVYVGPVAKIAPHAHLVEFGTGPRALKKSRKIYLDNGWVTLRAGQSVGQMPAKPFMRPAFDATKQQMLNILVKEIAAELVKAVKRLRKRAKTGKLGSAQLRSLQ